MCCLFSETNVALTVFVLFFYINKKCVYFTHLPRSPLEGICIKFCATGPLADIINRAKFYLNRFRGFDYVGVEFSVSP